MPPARRRVLPFAALPIVVVLAVVAPAPVSAINYLGDRAAACATLGAGGTHLLTLNNGTSVGTTLLAIGLVSAGAAGAGTPISDSRANVWVLAHSVAAANGARLFVYETRIAPGKSHSPGDTVTLAFAGGNGQRSCAVLSLWDGLRAASSVDRTNGASGTNNDPTVATGGATIQNEELLLASFGFVAATGGFSLDAPLQFLSGACDAPVCLFPGYRLLSTTASYTASAATNNVTNWGALLVTFRADNTVFADGFENGTTANWSSTTG